MTEKCTYFVHNVFFSQIIKLSSGYLFKSDDDSLQNGPLKMQFTYLRAHPSATAVYNPKRGNKRRNKNDDKLQLPLFPTSYFIFPLPKVLFFTKTFDFSFPNDAWAFSLHLCLDDLIHPLTTIFYSC